MANTWFNEDVYLQNKLTAWQDEAGNADKDLDALKKAIADAGMTPESHFLQFGADEGLSPNEFFVIDEYVANQVVFLNDRDGVTTWTADSFKNAVKDAGMTLWSHYQQYGWAEANPSNSFDAEQYFADKLTALQEDPATKAEWADKTVTDVKDAFEKAGIDPVSHYFAYGKDEGVAVTPVDTQPNTLTEGLKALDKANQDLTDFLAGLELDTDFDGVIDVKKGNAVEANVTTLKTTAIAKVDDAIEAVATRDAGVANAATDAADFTFTPDSYTNGSPNVKAALLADVKAHLATRLTEAKAAIAAEQAKVDKVAGLNAAVIALDAAKEVTKTAQATADDAAAALVGAKSTFESRETSTDTLSVNSDGEYLLGSTPLLSLNDDGKLVVDADWAAISTNAAFKPFAESLLAAVNADTAAKAALQKAQESEYQATIARDFLDLNTAAKADLTAVANAMVLTALPAGTTPTLKQIQTEATKLQSLLATLEGKIDALAAGADAAATEANFKALTAAQVESKLLTAAQKTTIDSAFSTTLDGDNANLVDAITDAKTSLDTNNNSATFDAAVATLITLVGPTNTGSSSVNELAASLAAAQDLVTNVAKNGWQDLLDALDKALENETTASANVTKLESLKAAIEDAEAFFDDNGYAAPELLDAAAEYASPESDVFVLDGIDSSIANFGALGTDALFIGGKYVQNTTGDLTKGNDAVLEFFVKQNGSDTEVIFEQKAFGSSAATPEVFTITLTGVTATDLVIDADFISFTAA